MKNHFKIILTSTLKNKKREDNWKKNTKKKSLSEGVKPFPRLVDEVEKKKRRKLLSGLSCFPNGYKICIGWWHSIEKRKRKRSWEWKRRGKKNTLISTLGKIGTSKYEKEKARERGEGRERRRETEGDGTEGEGNQGDNRRRLFSSLFSQAKSQPSPTPHSTASIS